MSCLGTFDSFIAEFSCPQKGQENTSVAPSEAILIPGAEFISKSLMTLLVIIYPNTYEMHLYFLSDPPLGLIHLFYKFQKLPFPCPGTLRLTSKQISVHLIHITYYVDLIIPK